MKIQLSIAALLIPLTASGQPFQGMSEQQMQSAMEQMQKAQSCMQNVDQAELQALEQRSHEFKAEVKSLCAGGKRDEAQQKAIAYGQEIAQSNAIQTMRKCGEMMQGMVAQMPMTQLDRDFSNEHVCDTEF